MGTVDLSMLMREVMSFCPDAVIREEADGNIAIVTMMRIDGGVLVPFDSEFDKVIDD